MTTVWVLRSLLKAFLLFVSDDLLRPAMMGLHFDVSKKSCPVVVATTGEVMAVMEVKQDEVAGGDSFTVPLDILKDLARGKASEMDDRIEFEYDGKTLCTVRTFKGYNRTFEVVDESYPAWRQVLDIGELSGDAAQYKPDNLMRFQKAKNILSGSWGNIYVGHNGKSAAIVSIGLGEFFGVIMPFALNGELIHKTAPDYAK